MSQRDVELLSNSNDPEVWTRRGTPYVVLTTIGRRTGAVHKVALPFWWDPTGARVVVASFAGAPRHPHWYLNLTDRSANRTVSCLVCEGHYWSVPEVLEGDEYEDIWRRLTADRPWYARYQEQTDRRIPLVRLAERS